MHKPTAITSLCSLFKVSIYLYPLLETEISTISAIAKKRSAKTCPSSRTGYVLPYQYETSVESVRGR